MLRSSGRGAGRARPDRTRGQGGARTGRARAAPNCEARGNEPARIADLQKSGELLRLSRDIRALIELVGGSLAGRADVDAATIDAWKRCALEEADKLDPIISGQVLTHLRAPSLESVETL